MAKKQQEEGSMIPVCLSTLNELISKVEKSKSGCFSEAPDYFKQELSNIKTSLLTMFKNLSLRMGGEIPSISAEKIIACADSLEGIDEQTRSELLALASIKAGAAVSLTPELIKENINSFRVVYDESCIEANEESINFHAKVEFAINAEGKDMICSLDSVFEVPEASLVLKQKI